MRDSSLYASQTDPRGKEDEPGGCMGALAYALFFLVLWLDIGYSMDRSCRSDLRLRRLEARVGFPSSPESRKNACACLKFYYKAWEGRHLYGPPPDAYRSQQALDRLWRP
jgi:hypothetical protein